MFSVIAPPATRVKIVLVVAVLGAVIVLFSVIFPVPVPPLKDVLMVTLPAISRLVSVVILILADEADGTKVVPENEPPLLPLLEIVISHWWVCPKMINE